MINIQSEEGNLQQQQLTYGQIHEYADEQLYIIETRNKQIKDQYNLMSRCQHGDVISVFCIRQSCTSQNTGGCQQCMKKYHNHSLTSDLISQEKLQELFKKLLVKPDIRIKSRPLQQALYNYFMIMKSQINSSLDAVSRQINNRLGYPYLHKKGYLGPFKKIKNREYKQIKKSELISFYKFANQADPNTVQEQQKMLYHEEISLVHKTLSDLNQVFLNYSKSIAKFDSTFNVEKSFYDKIKQLVNVINENKPKSDLSDKSSVLTKVEDSKSSKNQQLQNKVNRFLPATLNLPKAPKKDRKISFDVYGAENKEMSKFWTDNYQQNQKQIQTKKKKLLDMLSDKKNDGSDKVQHHLHDVPTIRVHIQQNGDKKQFGSKSQQMQKAQRKNYVLSVGKNVKDSEQGELTLMNDLIEKGINIPQMIAHKILPRQVSRQKLYEDTKDVKQRKITIPVPKISNDIEQVSSPLLKKRKKKKQEGEGGLKLEPITSQYEKQEESHKEQMLLKTPEKQDNIIKDKQADSLALLVQSLPMPTQKAIPLLEASIKHAFNNLSAAEYLSYLYLDIGKPKQCLDLCNQFLEQLEGSPNASELSVHISNNKSAALNMLGRYSESISILEKCILHSQKDIYYKNLGDAYFCIGIYEKAIIQYDKAISMNSYLDQAIYNLAVCHYMQQHMHEAQLNIQRALKLSPKNQQYNELYEQIKIKIKA